MVSLFWERERVIWVKASYQYNVSHLLSASRQDLTYLPDFRFPFLRKKKGRARRCSWTLHVSNALFLENGMNHSE